LSRWHKQYWQTAPPSVRVDHNLAYLVNTKAIPNYDTSITISPSLISSEYAAWISTDQTIPGQTISNGGELGLYNKALGRAGSDPWIGLDDLWNILYLYSFDDRMLTVMLGNADLFGRFMWHFREADASAGSGHYFDAPATGTVSTLGRVVSVNARQAVTLDDVTMDPATDCGSAYAADKINTGTMTDDGMGGYNLGPSHIPASTYTPYLFTGQYYYLEELQYEAAYLIGYTEGCNTQSYQRQLSWGLLNESETRGNAWSYRTVGYAAFVSPDGSPEAAYFSDKLLNNIAVDEGRQRTAASYSSKQTIYNWGSANRVASPGTPSPLGVWDEGNSGLLDPTLTSAVKEATSLWMENFVICALGTVRDFGWHTDNLLTFMSQRVFNLALNPVVNPYLTASYRFPTTLVATNNWVQTWGAVNANFTAPLPTQFDPNEDTDNGYNFIALGSSSFVYPYTSGSYTGQQAWNWLRANIPSQGNFATISPKFDIMPRTGTSPTDPPPTVSITSPTSGATVSGTVTLSATASAANGLTLAGLQFQLDGANLGADLSSAPFSITWDTTTASNGGHTLTAIAKDSSGQCTTSAAVSVTVSNGVLPPVISNVGANPSSTSAVITWTTSTPADSLVLYGTSTSYGQTSTLDSSLVTAHSVTLTGLTPSTLYDYEVQSQDGSGNTVTSANFTFTTTAQSGGGIPPGLGWYAIPNSTLQAVCPPASQYPQIQGIVGCAGVIEAWSSGVNDSTGNRLIIWGGGHGDYFGNEVYALDLTALAMKRLNNPSTPGSLTGCPSPTAYPDGTPAARHTYDGLAFIADADRMFVFGGGLSGSCGMFSTDTWTLNLPTLQWQLMSPGGTNPQSGPGAISDYDPNSTLVILHDYVSGLYGYNYSSNAWTQLLSDPYGIDYHMTGVIDPKRKLFLAVGGCAGCTGSGVQVYNVAGPTYTKSTPSVDSSCNGFLQPSNPEGSYSPGTAYDPVLDKIVVWPNFGNTVYLMDDTTWTCTAVTYPGGPPDSHMDGSPSTSRGTFGRFRYMQSSGVFVLVNDYDINAYTLRLH